MMTTKICTVRVVVIKVQFYGALDHSSQRSYFVVVLVSTVDQEFFLLVKYFAISVFTWFNFRRYDHSRK